MNATLKASNIGDLNQYLAIDTFGVGDWRSRRTRAIGFVAFSDGPFLKFAVAI